MNQAQLLLHRKFIEYRERNPRFTLRAYAQRAGLSSGALSEILKGKRPLSEKTARKVSERLGLSPKEVAQLLDRPSPKPKLDYEELSQDQFHVIADWWHFAILNLVKTKDFRPEEDWIAERLELPQAVASDAVARLFRLGLLKASPSGTWSRSKSRYSTTDDVLNLSVRRAHLQDLELVKSSLEKDGLDRRDMTSITFAVDPVRLPEAKSFIREFQDEFAERFETGRLSEVYKLSIQLFPLSKPQRRSK